MKENKDFIEESVLKHNNKYDYSKTKYKGHNIPVCIICPEHGEFWQKPSYHISGCGCPKCANDDNTKRRALGSDEFIKKSLSVHKRKYDYTKVVYENYHTKVCIICPEHGEFWQTPRDHLNGCGCPKCGGSVSPTTEEWKERARKVHAGKYDYSKVEYKRATDKVCIICPEHGEFWQTPHNHLKGQGCPMCKSNKHSSSEDFIAKSRKIHGDKYDYSKVEYVNNKTKVCIICPEHGEFYITPNSHLSGQGCRKCGVTKNGKNVCEKYKSVFVEKSVNLHGEKYDYSKTEYKTSKDKVCIICPEHGEFWQTPNAHLMGQGCPKCGNRLSKGEEEIFDFIKNEIGIVDVEMHNRNIIDNQEIDIFIPSKNIGFEYDGLIWHSEKFGKDKRYHINKTFKCGEKGVKLIHIFEDEWLNKREIVKSRLKMLLTQNSRKIYARDCTISELNSKVSAEFMNKNHLQGNAVSKYRYGLYYNNELVSVMTFCKLRKNLGQIDKAGDFELIRFCNKLNTVVIGGASKMLKAFIKNVSPKRVISYADRRWSNGNLYEKLGFKHIRDSEPNYFYALRGKRYNRFGFRKDILVKQGYDKNKTEHEIMLERGIYRIYDCGTMVFELKI